MWSYGDEFGGPVLDVRYGRGFCIEFENGLPANHVGFGMPEITSHLHNFHTATESDGGPWNWVAPGQYRNQHYTMARAGFTQSPASFADPLAPGGTWWAEDGGGDLRETLTTMFIHDHRPEFTSQNVYRGLAMMVRAFDRDDAADESRGFRLPWGERGECDVPLIFADKRINAATGELIFNQFATDGYLGDLITVNGKHKPFMKVKRRRYRFRVLNAGPSRFYNLVLRRPGQRANQPMTLVTRSGNLLQRSRQVSNVDVWVAERSDIVIDFSGFRDGEVLYLANILEMRSDGRGSKDDRGLNPDAPANQVLRFEIDGEAEDFSYNFAVSGPRPFRPLPPLPDLSTLPRKLFKFGRKNGAWTINDRFWDPDLDHDNAARGIGPPYVVAKDGAELWTLESTSGGWDHPLHIHFEEGVIIRQNGVAVAQGDRYRSDIHRLRGNRVEVFMRFRDFPEAGYSPTTRSNTTDDHGRYVMHCHNVVHEDHAMMATWSVRAPTS